MIFDGEFKDNKRWRGKIKDSNSFRSIKYEGEIRDGNFMEGKIEDEFFIGEIRNGKKWNGYGKDDKGNYNIIFKEGKQYIYC